MCVADILKLTVITIGVIVIIHLILNLLLKQDTTERFESLPSSSKKKRVTFQENTQTITIPDNDLEPNDEQGVNLAELRNELHSWMSNTETPAESTQFSEIDQIFKDTQVTYNKNVVLPQVIVNEDDHISELTIKPTHTPAALQSPPFQQSPFEQHGSPLPMAENGLKNWDENDMVTKPLEQIPKPEKQTEYQFQAMNVTTPAKEVEPMAFNSAEHFQQPPAQDGELYAWDGGFDSGNYSPL